MNMWKSVYLQYPVRFASEPQNIHQRHIEKFLSKA
ncbi:hypothetical protein M7I_3685 [Glarea lozoyensis 74030]|uniref:Uncharacterized protein n=1 Tax=Glarea lozoyensis (strain ATCC 74030 / MF5533) TaxID=1104152 RepID=H0EM57_GLAL7|nr:hypothetical protein M7I_3685 [Glarea lozoyensis 74030]